MYNFMLYFGHFKSVFSNVQIWKKNDFLLVNQYQNTTFFRINNTEIYYFKIFQQKQ